MRTKSAITILTATSLLTGCGSINSEMKDSSAVDITVLVDDLESDTTTDTTPLTTTSTSTYLVQPTSTTTAATRHTRTDLVMEALTESEPTTTETKPICEELQPTEQLESSADVQIVEGNVCPVTGITLHYTDAYCICEQPLTVYAGVTWYNEHRETYYSENVLPGSGLAIPDRHHGDDGTIRDANGYICVAADYNFLPYGSIVVTSLGPGKVYDTGCAWGTIDIYTCW